MQISIKSDPSLNILTTHEPYKQINNVSRINIVKKELVNKMFWRAKLANGSIVEADNCRGGAEGIEPSEYILTEATLVDASVTGKTVQEKTVKFSELHLPINFVLWCGSIREAGDD